MRNLSCFTLLLVALLISTSTVYGDDKFDPAARAAAVAPYLDDQVIAVAHVDPARIDPAAMMDKLVEVMRPTPDQKTEMTALGHVIQSLATGFSKAGGRGLYVVASLADLPRSPPFILATVKEGGDPRALARMLQGGRAIEVDAPTGGIETTEQLGKDVVFAGSKVALARLKGLRASPRPELAKAFEAAGDTAAQVVVVLTEDSRRVIRETLPTLPPEIGGGSGKAVSDGFQWAAVGINAPPKLSVQVTIQSKDAESAAELAKIIGASFALAGNVPEVRQIVPKFDELVKLMTPAVKNDRLTLVLNDENGGVPRLFEALAQPVSAAREAARRAQSTNNLKQLALAMHNYHDTYTRLPAAASYSKDGKPLLSWRVHVLPFVEGADLYKQFHLDEPWDSEHNRKLVDKMPKVYASPLADLKETGKTTYLAPVAAGTAFGGKEGTKFQKITDGTSNTIMLVDAPAAKAVVWTKPDDLVVDLDKPQVGLISPMVRGFLAAICDGSVRFFSDKIDAATLRALLTIDGGEVVDTSKF